MNFKKILALVLVMALTAAVTFGATLAFLTDETETKHNVFNVGKVNVSLTEKTSDTTSKITTDESGAQYDLVAPGDKLEKEVTVTNNGSLDAYVAVTVKLNNADKINAAIDDVYEKAPYNYDASKIQAIYDEVFEGWGINYSPRPGAADVNDARGVIDGAGSVWKLPEEILKVDFSKTTDFDNDTTMFGINNWFQSEAEQTVTAAGNYSAWLPGGGFYTSKLVDDTTTEADERDYTIVYTYYIKLAAGKSVTLFEGLNVPDYFVNDQMDMFDGLTIDISGAAIQADNFADAKAAFEALYAQPTPVVPDVPDVVASSADELVEALESDAQYIMLGSNVKIDPASMSNAYGKTGINVKNGQTIDGNGNTIDIKGAGGTWDSGINTTGGTIKNITITGSFRGIFINHNSTHSEPVVLENVTIDGTIYTISCDQGLNQTLIATNSTFKGWTSYAATLGEATFTGCYFGEGNGYAFCRPYAPTTFVGCDFEAGYEMDPRAAVTFENCTIGGVALTAENLATLVTSNIENATVK